MNLVNAANLERRVLLSSLPALGFAATIPDICFAQSEDKRREDLKTFYADLTRVVEAGDLPGFLNLYLPDATMVLPHRPPLLGREQIGTFIEVFLRKIVNTGTFVPEKMDFVGDIAIVLQHGTGQYLIKEPPDPVRFDNRTVDILRYVNGRWLMFYHLVSSSVMEPGFWERDWEKA